MIDPYLRGLKREMNRGPSVTPRSKKEIEEEIEVISGLLRGHLHNADRLTLVGDRVALRKQLAVLSN